MRNRDDYGRSDHDLLKVLFWHSCGRLIENYGKPQFGYTTSQLYHLSWIFLSLDMPSLPSQLLAFSAGCNHVLNPSVGTISCFCVGTFICTCMTVTLLLQLHHSIKRDVHTWGATPSVG